MRVQVLVLYLAVVLSFITHGTEGDLDVYLSRFSIDMYKTYIQQIRNEVTIDASQLYGIPILKRSVPYYRRFFLITISNTEFEIITLAVDILNLRVVAYRSVTKSYFFSNAPKAALHRVFLDTHQNILDFDNTFQSIEIAGGTTRLGTSLGMDPLELAISNLYHNRRHLVPESFLVIIQMIIEASKFRFIEQSVINSIRDGNSFTPELAIVSLEDNWSELSAQIQASKSLQGVFGNAITLYNSHSEPITVDSIYYPIVMANIALQRYRHCVGNAAVPNSIRMLGVGDYDARSNGVACDIHKHTTRISGAEGYCAGVEGGEDYDGNHIIWFACQRKEASQKWTFQSDGTIRSLGKCLTTNISSFGIYPVIYNCDEANRDDIIWQVSTIGTVLHPSSNLVLTINVTARYLTMRPNTYATSQSWRVGDYPDRILVKIIGLNEMCLEATEGKTTMWLAKCVNKYKREQFWALFSDQTIRVNSYQYLCVTSPVNATSGDALITVTSCNESPRQRWSFMSDGTILNPATSKRMEVLGSDVSHQKIILSPKNDSPNQQWFAFY